MNEIVNEGYYDASPFAKKMASYGRKLDTISQGTGEPGSLAKMSDEELGMMNKAGSLARVLVTVGSDFGVKDPSSGSGNPQERLAKFFKELEAKSGVDKPTILKMFKKVEELPDGKVADNEPDNEPEDEPEDEFDDGPSDDEIDAQARAMARGK